MDLSQLRPPNRSSRGRSRILSDRVADAVDYDELAEFLIKSEGLLPGQIAERISELTGINYTTVFAHTRESSGPEDTPKVHVPRQVS